MNDDRPQQLSRTRSRRTALGTLGAGVFVAIAGCLGTGSDADGTETSTRPTDATSDTDTETAATPTIAHEQSIVTTDSSATADVTDGSPRTAVPTDEPTPTAPRTDAPTLTAPKPDAPTTPAGTPAASATPSLAETRTERSERTAAATASPTETPTPDRTATATPTAPSTASGWAEQAPLPAARSDAGGGVLDGKLYFFGGIETAAGLAAVDNAFAYDPTAGTGGDWERLPALPRKLWGPCGVATDDALYSFGGAPADGPYEGGPPPSDAVFRYRPGEGWTDLTATEGVRCPYPNWVMGGVYDPTDGLIYCVGGGTGARDAATASDHGFDGEAAGTADESRVWTFDPATDRVADADLARMPTAKRWPTVALLDAGGKRYVHAIGGLLGTTGPTATNFRYDVAAGDWESARPMPRPGTYATHGNPVIDNRAYLTHGMFWQGRPTTDRYETVAHRYDPTSDGFATDLPEPSHRRGGATSGVIDGTLYVVGGHIKRFDRNGLHDCVAHNEAYTPAR